MADFNPVALLAEELQLTERQVDATCQLLGEGSTVPFIARYRKEVTGGLDEVQIRAVDERRTYLLELQERRASILAQVAEQGKLTADLQQRLMQCTSKSALEDLYLPYKPKRRTRATIAREKGLQGLAERILEQPLNDDLEAWAHRFVDAGKEVAGAQQALAGARDIVSEITSEKAEVRAIARQVFAGQGTLISEVVPDKVAEASKFAQYHDFREAVADIPSHRFLALRRGEREGFLRVRIELNPEQVLPSIRREMHLNADSPYASQLEMAIVDGYTRLLAPSVETDVRVDLKLRSDREAVEVFASNLRNLLLAAPLGGKPVIGIDPGLRTGCKCVALSATGTFRENLTLFLSGSQGARDKAEKDLVAFIQRHPPHYLAIGNGTGGRETEAFARQVLAKHGLDGITVVPVNEAGASVYSASDTAREEFPELDVTVRGAISIGRRLQNPLAELVKIDPKAIGVGQYQHDVHQPLLQRKLDDVVESCVNHVGVEVNTASAPLLARVAGIGPSLAKKIVAYRDDHGPFSGRMQLLDIPGMGQRTFEQAAGFLRIRQGDHPLDASAVHPERYALVAKMAEDLHVELKNLVGSRQWADRIDIKRYMDDLVGEPTLRDIVSELQKPGRDPRAEFTPPRFRQDVFALEHLQVGMDFEGIVTNVTAFGAFVDIGVHQDGLVHISQLADRFVKDPHEVVRAGDKLKVRVLEVDVPRKRISLTAKTDKATSQPEAPVGERSTDKATSRRPKGANDRAAPARFSNNPFAKLRTGR